MEMENWKSVIIENQNFDKIFFVCVVFGVVDNFKIFSSWKFVVNFFNDSMFDTIKHVKLIKYIPLTFKVKGNERIDLYVVLHSTAINLESNGN